MDVVLQQVLRQGMLSLPDCIPLRRVSKQVSSKLDVSHAWPRDVHVTFREADDAQAFRNWPMKQNRIHLSIHGSCRITDSFLTDLESFHITGLDLHECPKITDNVFIQLLLPSTITKLCIDGCIEITDRGWSPLPILPITELSMNNSYPDAFAVLPLKIGHSLTKLSLQGDLSILIHLEDKDLAPLSSFQSLTFLDLSGQTCLTGTGFTHLSNLPLHTLILDTCWLLEDIGLSHLPSLHLHTLNLNNCFEITDDGLTHLTSLPLTSLNMRSCISISQTGIDTLAPLNLTTFIL